VDAKARRESRTGLRGAEVVGLRQLGCRVKQDGALGGRVFGRCHAARNRVRLARGGIDEAVTGNRGAVANFASGGAVGRVERVGEAKTACDTVVEAATETNRKEVVL